MKSIRHGELWLRPVKNNIDDKATKKVDNYIVSHSETGHHHVLESANVLEEGQEVYVSLDKDTKLKHEKSFNRHKDLEVGKGIYRVVKKRQVNLWADAIQEVRD